MINQPRSLLLIYNIYQFLNSPKSTCSIIAAFVVTRYGIQHSWNYSSDECYLHSIDPKSVKMPKQPLKTDGIPNSCSSLHYDNHGAADMNAYSLPFICCLLLLFCQSFYNPRPKLAKYVLWCHTIQRIFGNMLACTWSLVDMFHLRVWSGTLFPKQLCNDDRIEVSSNSCPLALTISSFAHFIALSDILWRYTSPL